MKRPSPFSRLRRIWSGRGSRASRSLEKTCFKEILERVVLFEHVVVGQFCMEEDQPSPAQIGEFRLTLLPHEKLSAALFQARHHLLRLLFGAAMVGVNID